MPTDPTVVTREHLGEWMRHMQRPAEDGGQGLTAQTALQRYRSISRFFAWLVKEDEIHESPMARMSPPKVPEKLVPVVDDADLHKLFKAVDGADFEARRDKAILSLFIDVGLRIAEMTALKLTDVDIEARFVTVMGKGRRPREVRFTTTTRADINRYMRKRATHPHADSPKLWIGRAGDMTGSGIYRMVARRAEEAGIAHIHPHQLRHTFAHMYLRNGGNEGNLMQVTGWKSRSMVDRYGPVWPLRGPPKRTTPSPRGADCERRRSAPCPPWTRGEVSRPACCSAQQRGGGRLGGVRPDRHQLPATPLPLGADLHVAGSNGEHAGLLDDLRARVETDRRDDDVHEGGHPTPGCGPHHP